jgi:hypothetical protein
MLTAVVAGLRAQQPSVVRVFLAVGNPVGYFVFEVGARRTLVS